MYILIGLFIGFLAAIPLGPVNVFVISQVLKRDFLHGFMAGLTAAILDTVYCLIAVLGISLTLPGGRDVTKFLPLLKGFAALVLLVFGVRMYLHSKTYKEPQPPKDMARFSPRPLLGVVLLYVSNPTIYAFWLFMAGSVSHYDWMVYGTITTRVFFALSCGIGGGLWYFILTHYVAKHHHQFQLKTFQKIFFVLAVVLILFAAYTVVSIFMPSLKLL